MSLEGPIQAAFPTVGELCAPGLSSRLTETSTWGLLIINRWSSAQTNQESARSRRARCAQGDGRTHWNSPRPLTPLHTAGGAHLFSGACITGLSAERTAAWSCSPCATSAASAGQHRVPLGAHPPTPLPSATRRRIWTPWPTSSASMAGYSSRRRSPCCAAFTHRTVRTKTRRDRRVAFQRTGQLSTNTRQSAF